MRLVDVQYSTTVDYGKVYECLHSIVIISNTSLPLCSQHSLSVMESAPSSESNLPQEEEISLSDALTHLSDQQQRLVKWIAAINSKIYELETSYLEDTSQGNVVKGWDVDGRPPLHRSRGIEDKERLFSFSSYAFFLAKKSEEEAAASSQSQPSQSKSTAGRNRKRPGLGGRKRKAEEDWIAPEDY